MDSFFVSALILSLSMAGTSGTMRSLPSMSPVVEQKLFNIGGSEVVNLWQHDIRQAGKDQARFLDPTSAKTIVSPHSSAMMNLVPMDAGHPLYDNSASNVALRNAFLADSFISRDVDPDDETMASSEGLTVKNFNEKNLVFKKAADGSMTVNDIKVLSTEKLEDGTRVYIIDDLLFNHRAEVTNAFQQLARSMPTSGGEGVDGFRPW